MLDYCRYSANPVGHLVLYLCESYDERRAELSDRSAPGLQLANFWQDVARDLDIGRVYLPAEDRRRFGYSDDDLARPAFTPAFAELMRFEVERARQLFVEGMPLVPLMPADVRPTSSYSLAVAWAFSEKSKKSVTMFGKRGRC